MTRGLTWMLAVAVLSSPAAQAQDHKVELSATAGWIFSDGVTGSGDFARIDPKDAFSWGARIGFVVNENAASRLGSDAKQGGLGGRLRSPPRHARRSLS